MKKQVGEWISQIRNLTKSLRQSNLYITDRLIFSLIKKHSYPLIYQEDSKMKIMKMDFLFSSLPIELKDVDIIDSGCKGISSDCTIKRSKDKLPPVLTGYWGPVIRSVTSLDGRVEILPTTLRGFNRKKASSDFKYNNNKYYWFFDDYLYFPELEWDMVTVDAIFEDLTFLKCDSDPCKDALSLEYPLPNYLIPAIQRLVMEDLGYHLQIPATTEADKTNLTK